MAKDFDGEDMLKPAIREALEKTRASVERLSRIGAAYGWQAELREPTADEVQEFKDAINRGGTLL